MTRHPEAGYVEAVDFPVRPADRHPDTLAWIAVMERLRLEAAPERCPTCASTVTATQTRTCAACGETKPISGFARNRWESSGYRYTCKPCHAARNQRHRQRARLPIVRAILGRTA